LGINASFSEVIKREMSMKNVVKVVLAASCIVIAGCDVDTKGNVEVPDVDVNASGGELPDVDVTGPEVNVGMENKTVQTPTVDVDVPEENAQ
jgi:predicted small lipoprotein YifL